MSKSDSKKRGCLHRFVVFGVLSAIAFALVRGCAGWYDMSISTVPDLQGKTYAEAKAILKDKGFTNVTFKEKHGRDSSWIVDGDIVAEQDPRAGTDTLVANEIEVKVSARSAEVVEYLLNNTGKAMLDLIGTVSERGFTPVYLQDGSEQDISSVVSADVANPNSGYAVAWVLTGVKSVDSENKVVTVTVQSPEVLEAQKQAKETKEQLEKNLPLSDAWMYMEKSFKEAYPYGFSLHNVLGVIKTEVVDANTWHLSAYCDITNGYGAKMKNRVADAYVVAHDGIVSVTNMSVS